MGRCGGPERTVVYFRGTGWFWADALPGCVEENC